MRSDSQLLAILHSLERETEKNDLIQEERERRQAARKQKIESELLNENDENTGDNKDISMDTDTASEAKNKSSS